MGFVPQISEVIPQLIDAGRQVVERGLVLASGGNLSARLTDDAFVVTASGTWLDRLTVADFSIVNAAGEVIGGADRPSVEWKLHHHTYAVRPDVAAVVHLHPQHALLVDARVLGQNAPELAEAVALGAWLRERLRGIRVRHISQAL